MSRSCHSYHFIGSALAYYLCWTPAPHCHPHLPSPLSCLQARLFLLHAALLSRNPCFLSPLLSCLMAGAPLAVRMHHSQALHADPKLSSLQDAFVQAFAYSPASAAAGVEAWSDPSLLFWRSDLQRKISSSLLCSMGNPLHTNPCWHHHS